MSQNAGGGRGVAESQPMCTAVHRSTNKLWRSNSIFNLWLELKGPEHLTGLSVDLLVSLHIMHKRDPSVMMFCSVPVGQTTINAAMSCHKEEPVVNAHGCPHIKFKRVSSTLKNID